MPWKIASTPMTPMKLGFGNISVIGQSGRCGREIYEASILNLISRSIPLLFCCMRILGMVTGLHEATTMRCYLESLLHDTRPSSLHGYHPAAGAVTSGSRSTTTRCAMDSFTPVRKLYTYIQS